VANYSCIYGVGAPKLSRTLDISVKDAQKLIDAYWARNWSVRQLAEDTEVKIVEKEMWLFNPVSRFWYSLRYKKDIFSTLNQGTGVYCFDRWIMSFRENRPQLTAQFHDEVVLCVRKGFRDKCTSLLKTAIEAVNKELKLNVTLDVDIQFGDTYAEIH
jgi:DNA polymerase I-like protein with 3'-5' exonuclease and polymerase domains